MKKLVSAVIFGLGVLLGASVYAQETAGCGNEPKAPVMNVSDVDHYNGSVDRYQAYAQSVRSYYGCVSKQAHEKQVEISKKAKADMEAVQKHNDETRSHITNILNKMQAELKAGGQKLGASASQKK